jgi:hypothetical protein
MFELAVIIGIVLFNYLMGKKIIKAKVVKDDLNNAKIKKRLKFTFKKLKLDKEKIKNSIQAIKKLNQDLVEKTGLEFFNNIYINIILKSPLNGEKKFKTRFFNLPQSIISQENNLKICLVNNDLNIHKNDQKLTSNEILSEKLGLEHEPVDILTNDEFRKLLKTTKNKANLNFIYSNILADDRLVTKYNQILGADINKLDIYWYNIKHKKNELYNHLKSLITTSQSSSILKTIDNKLFKLKAANTSMSDKSILINIMKLIYKAIPYILNESKKHNTIKSIVLKSENSPPFAIFSELDVDDLNYFE